MSRNSADVVVRLIARDEGLRKALKDAGPAGQKAMRQIEKASKPASNSLKAVDNVARDLKAEIGGLQSRLGPAGSALSAFGPIGFAVAGGLGAAAAAAIAMERNARAAIDRAAAIGDRADEVNLSAEAYQALQFAAAGARIEEGELQSALRAGNKVLSEAALGTGEFFSSLKDVNPELVEQVANLDRFEDRLEAVLAAYRDATTETERNLIATRAFGDGGVRVVQMLAEMEGGLAGATREARELGVVLSSDAVDAAQQASAAIAQNEIVTTNALTRIGISADQLALKWSGLKAATLDALAPSSIDDQIARLESGIGKIEARIQRRSERGGLAGLLFGSTGSAERLLEQRREQLEGLRARRDYEATSQDDVLSALGLGGDSDAGVNTALEADLNRLREESLSLTERRAEAEARLETIIRARAEAGRPLEDAEIARLRAFVAEKYRDREAIAALATAEADRAKSQAEARAEAARLDRLRAAAAQTLLRLGDATAVLARREAELAEQVREGVLSREQADALLARERDRLTGVADARERLAAALRDGLSPLERHRAETEALVAAQERANIPAAEFNRLLADRARIAEGLAAAEREAGERERFGETLEEAEARIREAGQSAEEVIAAKVEAERAVLEALGEAVADIDIDAYLSDYEAGLRRAEAGVDRLRSAHDLLGEGLIRNARDFDDLGDVALRVLDQIIEQALRAATAASAGGGGFFSSFFSSIGGAFGLGGGSGGGAGGIPPASTGVIVNHSGTDRVGAGGRQRRVDPALFSRAPRFHRGVGRVPGLRRGEVPSILERDERVVDRMSNREMMSILRRVDGRASAPVEVHAPLNVRVENHGSDQVSTEERRDARGERELLVRVGRLAREEAANYISSPRGQQQMRRDYGLMPTTRGARRG